jgi:hypothetical protein
MEPYSTPHRKPQHDGADLVGASGVEAHSGQTNLDPRIKPGSAPRNSQSSVSAALAAANASLHSDGAFPMRFPGDDGGNSLAEVAQRDLDAALQLLADRAQYITGAGGAAIALRRNGMNDLLCRASAGSNAPELGALLSTEFGLSGESVRTRRALRCDDAERDARVNREVCRELGIASVVVMPVVDDDQVLGVFELFSGKANAFGERDLSALQRLSEMVETAVKLARAAESVTEHRVPEHGVQPEATEQSAAPGISATEAAGEAIEVPIEIEEPVVEVVAEAARPVFQAIASPAIKPVEPASTPVPKIAAPIASTPSTPPAVSASSVVSPSKQVPTIKTAAVPKPLFWSVALSASGEAAKAAEVGDHKEDQSHVPPMLRNLRKCEACGFPVSTGRTLCVECEEKKWRGQLKPQPAATKQAAAKQSAISVPEARNEPTPSAVSAKTAEKTADLKLSDVKPSDVKPSHVKPGDIRLSDVQPGAVTKIDAAQGIEAPTPAPVVASATVDAPFASQSPTPASSPVSDFAFSAGMGSSQSWLAANKYILGAILIAAVAIAAFVFLH